MASIGDTADKTTGPAHAGSVVVSDRNPLGFLKGLRFGDMLALLPFVIFAVLFICSMRLGVDPILGAFAALLLTETGGAAVWHADPASSVPTIPKMA